MPAIDIVNLRLIPQNQDRGRIINQISRVFGSRAPGEKDSISPESLILNASTSSHLLNMNNFEDNSTLELSKLTRQDKNFKPERHLTVSAHIDIEQTSEDCKLGAVVNFKP